MKFNGYFDKRIVEYSKVGEDAYEVNLNTAYDHNCSEQQTVVLNEQQMNAILEYEESVSAFNRNERNYRDDFPETDMESVKMGLIEPSIEERKELAERQQEQADRILKIFSLLTNIERRRLYMYTQKRMSFSKIAIKEGVSVMAVSYSCNNAFRKLKPYGRYLQCSEVDNWTKLLLCTKA